MSYGTKDDGGAADFGGQKSAGPDRSDNGSRRSPGSKQSVDFRSQQQTKRDFNALRDHIGLNGRSDAGYIAEQKRAAALEAERQKKAAAEAERRRKEQARQVRFMKHREDAASRQQRVLLGELDEFEQGQINQSLTSMRKYKDQSGVAKWDIQEVADRPAYGLSRIAAIREGLVADEETHNEYLGALRSELASKKYNANLLDATDPANKGKYFSGDLMSGFRLIAANI